MIELSIIIPHHKETIEQVDPLFSALNAQIGIDWKTIEIIVCNDTDDCMVLDFSRYQTIFPRIKNLITETKNNVGLSRQYGVDNAKGKYITFCDSDDTLFSTLTLQESLSMIKDAPDGDIYKFSIITQHPNGLNEFRVNDTVDIWVYGKIYRRDYLVKNNIRFSPKLKYSEDVYYTMLVDLHHGMQMKTTTPLYVQRSANRNSVTRDNNMEYLYNGVIVDHIDSVECAIDYMVDSGKMALEDFDKTVVSMLTFYYVKYCYVYIERGFGSTKKDGKIKAEKRMAEFVYRFDPDLSRLKKYFDKNLFESKKVEEGVSPKSIKKSIFDFYAELLTNYSKIEEK